MTKAMEEGEIETKKAKAVRLIDSDPLYLQLEERMQRVQDELSRYKTDNNILQNKLTIAQAYIKELKQQVVELLPVPFIADK